MFLDAHGPVMGYPPIFENMIRKETNFLGKMCVWRLPGTISLLEGSQG